MFMDTFSIYDAIIYKKILEKENKTTDSKWDNLKNILICRLIHFGEQFYNEKSIIINSGLIFKEYCLFQVKCLSNKKEYIFFTNKCTDELLLMSIKHSNNKIEKFNLQLLNQIKNLK